MFKSELTCLWYPDQQRSHGKDRKSYIYMIDLSRTNFYTRKFGELRKIASLYMKYFLAMQKSIVPIVL